MSEQLNLFGECVSISEVTRKENRSIRRTFRKMYGFNHNHTCKDCKFLVSKKRDRTYYKCLLMGISSSEATDIKLKDVACYAWLRKEE